MSTNEYVELEKKLGQAGGGGVPMAGINLDFYQSAGAGGIKVEYAEPACKMPIRNMVVGWKSRRPGKGYEWRPAAVFQTS